LPARSASSLGSCSRTSDIHVDVSVRLGVLNLLRGLCDNEHLAILYITHDIASARYIADEVIVMYAGQVVEHSRGTVLVDEPTHPYTQLLIASVPNPMTRPASGPTAEQAQVIIAEQGCRFSPRCPFVMDRCRVEEPPQFIVVRTTRSVLAPRRQTQFEVEVACTAPWRGEITKHELLR